MTRINSMSATMCQVITVLTHLYFWRAQDIVRCNTRLTAVCKLPPHQTSCYELQVTGAVDISRAGQNIARTTAAVKQLEHAHKKTIIST